MAGARGRRRVRNVLVLLPPPPPSSDPPSLNAAFTRARGVFPNISRQPPDIRASVHHFRVVCHVLREHRQILEAHVMFCTGSAPRAASFFSSRGCAHPQAM